MTTVCIVGLDSDLAKPVMKFARDLNWRLIGSSRNVGKSFMNVDRVYFLDVSSVDSIERCANEIASSESEERIIFVFSIGTLEPIGRAGDISIQNWNYGFAVNGLGPFNFIQRCLELRKDHRDIFLTYAGNGTNSAPSHFSSYTLAKIMLVKAMEILAAEYPNKAFISLGTGWMKSKIHKAVQKSSTAPEGVFRETQSRITSGNFGDPDLISTFLMKIVSLDYEVFSGRNFSLQGDTWLTDNFWESIKDDKDVYKLRRVNK